MQPVDVRNLVNMLSSFWFKNVDNPDITQRWLDGLARLAEDQYLEMEQARKSINMLECPVYVRHRYAYRDLDWEVGASVHSYWRGDYDPDLVVTLDVYPDPSGTKVFVGGFLVPTDDYVITQNQISFVNEPGDTVSVVCHRYWLYKTNADLPITVPFNVDPNATQTWLFRKNITHTLTLAGSNIVRSYAFPVGTVLQIKRGISPAIESITVTSASTVVATSSSLIGATVYRVYNLKLGSVSVSGSTLTFSDTVPVDATLIVRDAYRSENIYVSSQNMSIDLINTYTNAAVYYGDIRIDNPIHDTAITFPTTDTEWKIALLSRLDHGHGTASVVGVNTITVAGINPEVYIDGKLLMLDEYTFNSNTGVVTVIVTVEAATEINVTFTTATVERHAHRIWYTKYTSQYVSVADEPFMAYGAGKNITPTDLVFRNGIVVLSYKMTYNDDLCFDIMYDTWPYTTALPIGDQLVAAEYMQNGIDIYTVRLDPTQFSIEDGVVYATHPVAPIWLVEADFDERTLYNVHGQLVGLPTMASSEAYRNYVLGMYYGLRHGRSKESVENGADILLGAPYTLMTSKIGRINRNTVLIVAEDRTVTVDPYILTRLPVNNAEAAPLWALEVRARAASLSALDGQAKDYIDRKDPFKSMEGSYNMVEVAAYMRMAAHYRLVTLATKGDIEDPRYFIHDISANFTEHNIVGCRVDIRSAGVWHYDAARVEAVVDGRLVLLTTPFTSGTPTNYRIWYQTAHMLSEWKRFDTNDTVPIDVMPREIGLFVTPAGYADAPLGIFCEKMSPISGRIVPIVTLANTGGNDDLFIGLSDVSFILDEVPAAFIIGEPMGPLSA